MAEKIDRVLLKIRDGHLKAYLPSLCNKSSFFGTLSSSRRKKRKHGSVGKNRNKRSLPWLIETHTVAQKKVLVVAITHFPPFSSSQWDGFTKAIEENIEDAQAVIVDLRGNGGGADRAGGELAKYLYGHYFFSHPVKAIYRRNTAEAMAISSNNFRKKIISYKKKGENNDIMKKEYEHMLNEAALQEEKKEVLFQFSVSRFPTRKDVYYKRPILVLIDAECGSSGKNTVDFLENLPSMITIGENTWGVFILLRWAFSFRLTRKYVSPWGRSSGSIMTNGL